MIIRKLKIFSLILFLFIFSLSYGTNQKESPNINIILTDDQGYQDVGVFGSPLVSTPHLDKMATDGIRFTDFYSTSPVCSPSRVALLTGSYPPRVNVTAVLWPQDDNGLKLNKHEFN